MPQKKKIKEETQDVAHTEDALIPENEKEMVHVDADVLDALTKKLAELDEENKSLKEQAWVDKALADPAENKKEREKRTDYGELGMTTAGVRNKVKGHGFVVVCMDCGKEVPNLTDSRCEDCWTAWLGSGGGDKLG